MVDSKLNIRNKLARKQIHSGVLYPMPRGYRLVILAALGFLVAASPAPDPAGVAQRSPATLANGGNQTSGNSATTDKEPSASMGIREEKARAAKREADAEQRDRANLAAAQLAARAADRQASLSEPAIWIGGIGTLIAAIGTILLFLAYRETRVTAVAATDSVGQARRAAEASIASADAAREANTILRLSVRPWIGVQSFGFGRNAEGQPIFQVNWFNFGNAPAMAAAHIAMFEIDWDCVYGMTEFFPMPSREFSPTTLVMPQADLVSDIVSTDMVGFDNIGSRRYCLWIQSQVKYTDVTTNTEHLTLVSHYFDRRTDRFSSHRLNVAN